jgi:hypothetical protein
MTAKLIVSTAIAVVFIHMSLYSQSKDSIAQLILHKDSTFWNAYNSCDTAGMRQFVAGDIEFYHDKGGPLYGAEQMMNVTQKNLCSNYSDFHLRREAVPGTVHVFPMNKSDTVYGAIITGQHYFYINQKGKKEFRDGLARFTHLWLVKNGIWKMARVLSFDHGPAPYENSRKEITISKKVLDRYSGPYRGNDPQTLIISTKDSLLQLTVGNNSFMLHPSSETVFFSMDRDLEFEFVNNELIVREHGNEVQRAKRIKK